MSLIDGVRYRLRILLRGRSHARELDEELAHHLELGATEAKSGSGASMSDDEAHWRARREFGNTTYSNEERRAIAGLTVFDAVGQDVRFVLRLLRRRSQRGTADSGQSSSLLPQGAEASPSRSE